MDSKCPTCGSPMAEQYDGFFGHYHYCPFCNPKTFATIKCAVCSASPGGVGCQHKATKDGWIVYCDLYEQEMWYPDPDFVKAFVKKEQDSHDNQLP